MFVQMRFGLEDLIWQRLLWMAGKLFIGNTIF